MWRPPLKHSFTHISAWTLAYSLLLAVILLGTSRCIAFSFPQARLAARSLPAHSSASQPFRSTPIRKTAIQTARSAGHAFNSPSGRPARARGICATPRYGRSSRAWQLSMGRERLIPALRTSCSADPNTSRETLILRCSSKSVTSGSSTRISKENTWLLP